MNSNGQTPAAEGSQNPQGAPFTAEQTAALAALIGESVNKALTGQLKKLKVPTADELLAKLREEEAARVDEEKQKAAPKPAPAGAGAEAAPEVVALRKQVESLTRKQEAAEKKAQELEAANVRKQDDEQILRSLEAGGVTSARARIALNHLRAEGMVRRGEEGLVFVRSRNGAETELDLGEGIAGYLGTEDGKHFVPASGSQGSGSGPVKRPTTKMDQSSRNRELIRGHFLGGTVE